MWNLATYSELRLLCSFFFHYRFVFNIMLRNRSTFRSQCRINFPRVSELCGIVPTISFRCIICMVFANACLRLQQIKQVACLGLTYCIMHPYRLVSLIRKRKKMIFSISPPVQSSDCRRPEQGVFTNHGYFSIYTGLFISEFISCHSKQSWTHPFWFWFVINTIVYEQIQQRLKFMVHAPCSHSMQMIRLPHHNQTARWSLGVELRVQQRHRETQLEENKRRRKMILVALKGCCSLWSGTSASSVTKFWVILSSLGIFHGMNICSAKIDLLAYFVKNEIITPAESAFVADHSDTFIFWISYTRLNAISTQVFFDRTRLKCA